MQKNKFKIKVIYVFLMISLIFGNSIGIVQAFGSSVSVPSFEEIADKAEKRYGFNSNTLRQSQGKAYYPQAEIFFDKTAPKKGEKVTATAMAKYFKTTNEDLYYNWFLFRDGEKDIEEAKRLAMGIVARGDFDPVLFETDYSSGSSDPDRDGYDASFGGDDGVGGRRGTPRGNGEYESENYIDPDSKQIVDTNAISRCYRHNFGVSNPEDSDYGEVKAGQDRIIECEHKFAKADKTDEFTNSDPDEPVLIKCKNNHHVGDGLFSTNEEACWRLDPTSSDTDGDGFSDEADLVGLGQSQLTWTFREGDRVGIIIEGTSMVIINEGANDSGTAITSESINLDGDLSGTSSTETDGGSVSMSGDASVNADGDASAFSTSSVSSDSTSETDLEGGISFGVTEETVATDRDTELNPYYKIAWAGLDFCDKEKVEGGSKKKLIENDECERNDDYGFTYLATKSVFEKSAELLKSNLNFTPMVPQFNVENNDYSDYITVQSNFVQSEVSDDFIYYDWDVYYCEEGDLDECTSQGDRLTPSSCSDGEILGKCAKYLDSNSYAEGIGINKIKFKLEDNFLSEKGIRDNFYLKVFLKVKRNKNDSMVGISSVDIPVMVNDNVIKFFKVSKQASGKYGFDPSLDGICGGGDYNKICPVYPGQIIAAQADVDIDGRGISNAESYLWELNGQQLTAPKSGAEDCSFANDGCNLKETVYLPILNLGVGLQSISLKVKKDQGEEITSERLISVIEPMAKLVSDNPNAWPWSWVVDEEAGVSEESDKVFVGKIGEIVSFKADLVPSYLDNNLAEESISLIWSINGQEVDGAFISKNSAQSIVLNNQNIDFKLTGKEGDSLNLEVEVVKNFSAEDKLVLKDNWNINTVKALESKKAITLKQTDDDSFGVVVKGSSIRMFTASTLANASEYFIFSIRTAIVLILFWVLVSGSNYWLGREIKIKE